MNTTGYLRNSPHRFNKKNVIPGGSITMDGVDIPLLLRPNKGKSKIVMPNSGNYKFPKADYVTETPLFQYGGIQDMLNAKGVDGSKKNRIKLFNDYFKGKYTGTAEQNIQLMKDIETGKINLPNKSGLSKAITAAKNKSDILAIGAAGQKAVAPTSSKKSSTGSASNTAKNLISSRQFPTSAGSTGSRGAAGSFAQTLIPTKQTPISTGKTSSKGTVGNTAQKLIVNQSAPISIGKSNVTGMFGSAGKKINKDTGKIDSGVIVDKRTGKAFTVKNGKVDREFDVLTGVNVDGNKNPDAFMAHMTDKQKVTPIGNYLMNGVGVNLLPEDIRAYNGNIQSLKPLGNTDKSRKNSQLAIHETYDPINRNKLFASSTPWASYGCVNCKKPDIEYINQQFPKGDTLRVIDSKMAMGKDYLSKYYQQGGGFNDCPDGFTWSTADQQCLPTQQAEASNFSGLANSFITGAINPQGQRVGGTGANIPNQGQEALVENQNTRLKRMFGTPNIPAIVGSNLLAFGLSTFANKIEEGRQKAFMSKNMNDPNFNGSYSNAQNDYGVDPFEQTGQLRRMFQKGGKFDVYKYLYEDDDESSDKQETKSTEQAKKKRVVAEDIMPTEQQELESLGMSDYDIVNMDSPRRQRALRNDNYIATDSAEGANPNDYTYMYLGHQQGKAGISAIRKAAEQGLSEVPRNWSKENIQANMKNNVGKDFQGELTPANFLSYWSGKVNRHMASAAKQQTPYDEIFQKIGQEQGVDPLFLKTVAKIESGLNPNNNTKSKYKGLFAMNSNTFKGNIFDPEQSTRAAAQNFKNFEEGGTYSVDFKTMMQLKKQGIKFKIIE